MSGSLVSIFLRLFIFRDGEEKEKERERTISGREKHRSVQLRGNWEPGPEPRHVSWPGIKPVTLRFAGLWPTHWATRARAHSWYLLNTFFVPGPHTFSFISKVRIKNIEGICRDTLNCPEGHKGAWPGRRQGNHKSPMKMKIWTHTAKYLLHSWISRNKSELQRQPTSLPPLAPNTALSWCGFRF